MPVVIGGEAIGIVDVFVFLCCLAIVIILWTLLQARGPVAQIPIVGSTGVNLIDAVRVQVTNLALSIEQFLTWQQAQITDLWNRAIHNVIDPATQALTFEAGSLKVAVEAIEGNRLPAIEAGVADLSRYAGQVVAPTLMADGIALGRLAVEEDRLATVVVPGIMSEAATTAQEVANLRAIVNGLVADMAAAQAILGRVAPFLGELAALGTFEAGQVSGVAALQQELTLQRGRIAGAESELSKLLALSGVAVLGAVAVANLVRIARDPCGICEGLDLSTVQARLTALEFFGET